MHGWKKVIDRIRQWDLIQVNRCKDWYLVAASSLHLSKLLISLTESYQDFIFVMNGKGPGNEIDGAALNRFEGVREWMVDGSWRLKMSKGKMMNNIILIFKTTL